MKLLAERRIVASLAAVVALATLVTGALYWNDLKRVYYRHRLHLDPSFLLELISQPELSLEQSVASDFLEFRHGKAALFEAYVTHLAEEIDHLEEPPTHVFSTFDGQRVWFDASYSGRKLEAGEFFCEQHHVVPAIRQLLPRLEGEVFRVPGADDFEFSTLPTAQAVHLYRQSIPDADAGSIFTFRGSDPYVCRVRKRG